ncbi:MAG: amidase family protein, partial [Actinomycetota bacterium]
MSIVSNIEKTLDNAEKLNGTLNSFLSIEREYAIKRAAEVEKEAGETALRGLAIALKDNICTKDLLTTCGSYILHNYKAHYDATATQRLKDAGAIIVGKTNMDEFAM